MTIAAVTGVACGIAGFAPLLVGLRLARRATPTSNLGHAGALLLGVLISIVILFAGVVACALLARDALVAFGLGAFGALVASAIAFGVYQTVRK